MAQPPVPNHLARPVPAFHLGVDPTTGWTHMPEKLNYWFDFPEYGHGRLPARFTICLALNEVGRQYRKGMVAWRGATMAKAEINCFELLYVGQEWSERDCEIWDSQNHEQRLKGCEAGSWLVRDSKVLPIDVQTEYVKQWVREEEHEVDRYDEKLAEGDPSKPSFPGAVLTYSRARFGTHNPPDISRDREHHMGPGISGVPHLSTNKEWAGCGGTFEKGISWEENLEWMTAAVKRDNGDVMEALQEMWEGGEKGVVVRYGNVEG